jgi:hypothetical protein
MELQSHIMTGPRNMLKKIFALLSGDPEKKFKQSERLFSYA